MILYFGMQLLPLGFGVLYFLHSIRKSRRGQAAAILSLLIVELGLTGLLVWEYLVLP